MIIKLTLLDKTHYFWGFHKDLEHAKKKKSERNSLKNIKQISNPKYLHEGFLQSISSSAGCFLHRKVQGQETVMSCCTFK